MKNARGIDRDCEAIVLATPKDHGCGVLFVLERFSGRQSNGTLIPCRSGPMGQVHDRHSEEWKDYRHSLRAAKTRNRPHALSTHARGRSSETIPAEQGRLLSAQDTKAIRQLRTSNGRWVDRIGVVGLIGKLRFSRSVPEPGRVPSCLHAGSRSVGNQDRPFWSLGIGAHWARHAWGITLGLTITEAAKRKPFLVTGFALADRGGFERPTGRHNIDMTVFSRLGVLGLC